MCQPIQPSAVELKPLSLEKKEVKNTIFERVNKVSVGNFLLIAAVFAFYGCIGAAIFVNPFIAIGVAAAVGVAVIGNKLRENKPGSPVSDSDFELEPKKPEKPEKSEKPASLSSTPLRRTTLRPSPRVASDPLKPKGISNESGSDCWINSMIQLLANISHFVVEPGPIEDRNKNELFEIISNHAGGTAPEVSTIIRNIMTRGGHNLESRGYGQQDAANILEFLNGNLGPLRKKMGLDGDIALAEGEGGVIQIPMSLDSRGTVLDLQKKFDESFSIHADSPEGGEGVVSFFYDSPPDYMILQLKRFGQINQPEGGRVLERTKIVDKMKLEGGNLKLKPQHCSGEANQAEISYDCRGFVYHIGNLDGGHYKAYLKRGEVGSFKFYECNDSRVSEISETEYLEYMKDAYIFHFQKVLA
jgi:hypothetical protein